MADGTYTTKVYTKQGGAEQVVASGGLITVESGGGIVVASGASLTVAGVTVDATTLAANAQTGANVAVVADDNLVGGLPVLHRLSIADGVTGDIDYVLTHKTRVVDVWLVKTGGAGHATEDTIMAKNGATAITDAIAVGNADKAIKRAGTIDDASWEVAAGGTLRITRTKGAGGGNNVECTVFVLGVRVA
jgi:hypothetical protein